MKIFPAIDMKDGKCVRLTQGDFNKVTVYNDNPLEVAKMWEEKGAEYIHLVDLDGAKEGKSKNMKIIKRILKEVKIPIQIGGGIRDEDKANTLIDIGVSRIILGTIAINNRELLKNLVNKYDEKIVVSVDAKKELVAIEGWNKTSAINSIEFVSDLEGVGVKSIVYTDIAKDGMMKGPNIDVYKKLNNSSNINIIASGGVSTKEDVMKLKEIGIYGCIIGKALYDNKISFDEVIKI
ncbi:1-(5-phosphoribosyl)-5-[(5-phosphoribosylamino)methylideneamino]imidazole-4-carboxamide isomerase [Dethiothermospora halolimnae]|uniref:1-(5-phosphoribosyl)-5-[(5- phosphoribosylamino)methylideneamino]imidazole-4- carboxamide isomerase n=1 Tax=Dethiothermospora halolimnae TaxID=3114390 RepID=UPI003CCBB824